MHEVNAYSYLLIAFSHEDEIYLLDYKTDIHYLSFKKKVVQKVILE